MHVISSAENRAVRSERASQDAVADVEASTSSTVSFGYARGGARVRFEPCLSMGDTGFEPVTFSVSRTSAGVATWRISLSPNGKSVTGTREHMLMFVAVVTQFVTHRGEG